MPKIPEFQKNIQDWVTIDNKIKNLQQSVKELRMTKSRLTDNIFNYAEQKVIDNIRSLQQDLTFKTSSSESNKYFNIQNLDAKNISLSILSPDFDIDKTFTLKDYLINWSIN